jgi:23S rRNA (cytosine1962-C5)-methyltransferase
MHTLSLRPKHDRRARRGHPWVFANEVERGGLQGLHDGAVVDVVDSRGRFVGRGLASPHEQVAVRLLGGKHDDLDEPAFWARRVREALAHRRRRYGDRADLRVVDGPGDRASGLTIDRLGGVARVALRTEGLRQREALVKQALGELGELRGATIDRGEGPEVWFGDVPDEVAFHEHGVALRTSPLADDRRRHHTVHGDARAVLAPTWSGATVLEAYAGCGAWALAALHHGAEGAAVIDKSELACGWAADAAEASGHELMVVCDEAKRTLELLADKAHRYDVVVLDPPPFAKHRKAVSSALDGYRELLAAGLTLVRPGGQLVAVTRSVHVTTDDYLEQVSRAARTLGRRLRQVYAGGQAADHPVLPEMPESQRVRTWAWSVVTDA